MDAHDKLGQYLIILETLHTKLYNRFVCMQLFSVPIVVKLLFWINSRKMDKLTYECCLLPSRPYLYGCGKLHCTFLKLSCLTNLHFVYPLTHDADRNGTQVQSRRERSTWSSLAMRKGSHWLKGFYLRLG